MQAAPNLTVWLQKFTYQKNIMQDWRQSTIDKTKKTRMESIHYGSRTTQISENSQEYETKQKKINGKNTGEMTVAERSSLLKRRWRPLTQHSDVILQFNLSNVFKYFPYSRFSSDWWTKLLGCCFIVLGSIVLCSFFLLLIN